MWPFTSNIGWTAKDIPELSSKVAIVTGSNIGLGKEIATQLANHGCHTILAVRSVEKGQATADEIKSKNPRKDVPVTVMELDLASLKSIDAFAAEFTSKYDKLDLLVCNAGLMALPERQVTTDGFEMQIGVNHLGHFALVSKLFGTLAKTPGSRIIHQSSSASFMGGYPAKWDADTVNAVTGYSKWAQYGFTKLANVAFSNEIDRRVLEKGLKQPRSIAVHPGIVVGQLQTRSSTDSVVEHFILNHFIRVTGLSQSNQMGALPTLYAATSPDAQGGKFYGPNGVINGTFGGYPKLIDPHPNKVAADQSQWAKLWEISEKMTGVKFNV
ncbi:short-chain dehydrogenase/reductase SDR [Gonapodya prolifera JEL478]|uniref:Short-chain dehydrogenase/reductase SDR n=1 Tax=Gonapodya prolifera (strain JEL478) TaxID=1344416 RepID=A0A139AVL3_GONPJ|nr:short-chain dehydrogenase/reductase SDR [Gonapodya prolifera JEL478]|eukprot:KXS20781.1 short-chain dehydrogenase/reductase SDR [Gonapodya prolifera JEL478]